jgi:bifunctional non-homologous end joining protein LigD
LARLSSVRDGKQWRYVGNVGAGFSHARLAELHEKLTRLITLQSPLATKVKNQSATTWVKPKLVAEIKLTEWTTAGEMRHPVFHKRAEDVVFEKELKWRPR